jgi:hypothetical protein
MPVLAPVISITRSSGTGGFYQGRLGAPVPGPRTQPVFPDVPRERGHYESFYLRASHPSEPLGVWIRHTVHKRPGEGPRGSVWFTLFEPAGPRASKVTVGEEQLSVPEGGYIRIGDSEISPGRVAGSAVTDQLDVTWQLTFDDGAPAFHHLPREWMYGARLPRTKTLSPHPSSTFSGRVTVGGRTIELDGWHGMVGHNWGAEHAERWIWTDGLGFGSDTDAYLDAAIGRIKVGPFTTPWIGNGVLYVDGELHRLGGLERTRSTVVRETPQGAQLVLPGKGVTVSGRVGAEPEWFVGWKYADPDGGGHDVVNCSIASMTLKVEREGRPPIELHTEHGASFELGMRESDHGVPVQPFPDG